MQNAVFENTSSLCGANQMRVVKNSKGGD